MNYSRESTVTQGWDDEIDVSDGGAPVPEDVPDHLLKDSHSRVVSKRLIIAVDFGTTYSAVSFVALEEGESTHYLDVTRIRSIQNFPNDWTFGTTDRMKSEVPTEVFYPLDPGFREKEDLEAVEEEDNHAEFPVEPPLVGHNGGSLAVFGYDQDNDHGEDDMPIDETATFRWGYGVHEAWGQLSMHSNPKNRALARFKLLLDDSPMTEAIRNELGETLGHLKKKGIISDPHHVLVDFLTCLLRHTKLELRSFGFDESYRMEIVLCVPAIWRQKACRDMQAALARAMERARFEGVDVGNKSVENLFIVSEPEAAAAYVLETERSVSPGDTFVLLDAGGGTVDANTYTVSGTAPLRLTREVVPPGGGLYGSSYLNEAFRQLLRDLLADETYLEEGENTINGYIEKIMMNNFEYRLKRSFDCYRERGYKSFDVPGLRENPEKGFRRGGVLIHTGKIKEMFLKCLEGIAGIMEAQIIAAMDQGVKVQKVILIGGFAESISLKKYLKQRLEQFCSSRDCHISLIEPDNTTTAVASGAVLRACNKEQGPRRYARSSYGVLRTEPHGYFPEHEGVSPSYDLHDGQPYVVGTIDWVLPLGREVEPVWKCEPFLCSHTFTCGPRVKLICRELLYVSDSSTESHYQEKHPKNAGAEPAGEIVVDFTFLREKGLIQPIDGGVNKKGKRVGKRHYKVSYTMVIQVVDRDLQCYAIYNSRVREKCTINIASAFSPGVK